MDRFVTGDDAPVIDVDPGNAARRRPGRDDDFLRLSVCFRRRRSRRCRHRLARRPLDPGDLVLLEQELDALGQPADDLVLPRVDLRHVDRRRPAADDDTPIRCVLNHLQRVGVLEQRLRRNTTPDQTGAAKRLLLFDDGNRLPELRGPDGSPYLTGSRAHHHDIVRIGRHNRLV